MMATLKADLLNILKKLPIPFFLAITIVAIVQSVGFACTLVV